MSPLPARHTEPLRTCVGCRQVKPQRQLNRLGVAEEQVVINPRRISGRSAYLCSDDACWAAAEKRRAVDRALGLHLSPEDWARLRQGILH
jgi:uncharacterized protein